MPTLNSSYDVESGFRTTLKFSISASLTTGITLNKVLTKTSGVLLFDGNTSREEWISYGGVTDNGDGTCTLSDVVRGLTLIDNDFAGSATRSFGHTGGVCKVAMVDYHALFNLKANIDRQNIFTAHQTLGAGQKLQFEDNNVTIERTVDDLVFKDINQAPITLSNLASLSGVNDKSKVSGADTTEGYLNSKIVAGENISTTILNPGANEQLEISTATPENTKIDGNLFSSVSANESIYFNGLAEPLKSDADILNANFRFGGIMAESGVAFEKKKIIVEGIAPINPPITHAARSIYPLAEGVKFASRNTVGDALSTTAYRVAQTFLCPATQDSIAGVVLWLTKTSFVGTATIELRTTTLGEPTNTILASGTLTGTNMVTGVNNILFSSSIALTPGETYAIVIRISSYTSGNFSVDVHNTTPYSDGQRFTSNDSGATWTPASHDAYFVTLLRGLSGFPIYNSSTPGELALTPANYAHKIGKILTPNKFLIDEGLKIVSVNYSFSITTAETVDTVISLGGRPRFITCQSNCLSSLGGNARPTSNGFWNRNGSATCIRTTNDASTVGLTLDPNNLGYVEKYSTPNTFNFLLNVQATSVDSVTIRRTISGSPPSVPVPDTGYVYLQIFID